MTIVIQIIIASERKLLNSPSAPFRFSYMWWISGEPGGFDLESDWYWEAIGDEALGEVTGAAGSAEIWA